MAAIRGYLAALAAGNLVFWLSSMLRAAIIGPADTGDYSIPAFAVVAAFVLAVSVVTTIAPFAVFLGIAWGLQIRTPLYFVACGATMGPIAAALTFGARWSEAALWVANASLWQNLMLAGAVGGWTYWRVGVRRATLTERRPRSGRRS